MFSLSSLVAVALALAALMPASATAEQRVTELASPNPPGAQSDFRPCGYFEWFGCEITVTPGGASVVFAATGGALYSSTRGVVSLASVGPNGEPVTVGVTGRYADSRFGVSNDAAHFVFRCPEGLCYRSGHTTRLVAQSYANNTEGHVSPHVVSLSADGSRAFYRFDSHNGCDCRKLYDYDGTASHRFPSDSDPTTEYYPFLQSKGVSPDGKRIFFTTTSSLVPQDSDSCFNGSDNFGPQPPGCDDVYERTADGQIRLISTGPTDTGTETRAQFLDATPDGSHVLFSIGAKLTPDAQQAGVYERAGDKLTYVRYAGWDSRLSADGSRVLFTTDQPLVPQDTDTCKPYSYSAETRGCFDLYEYHDGTYTLLSTGPHDPNGSFDVYFSGLSADAGHAFFVTTGALVASDTDSCPEYDRPEQGCADVYERHAGVTRLISAGPATSGGSYQANFRGASSDGRRVFFQTEEPLVASDTDTCSHDEYGRPASHPCTDIYERFGNTNTLVSTGPSDSHGDCQTVQPHITFVGCPRFLGASRDGRLVYFETVESLVPQDADGGQNDIYVSGVASQQCRTKQHGATPSKCWAGSAK